MIIRKALRSECLAISEIAKETYSESFGRSLKKDELQTHLAEKKSEAYFQLRYDTDMLLVAELNNKIIGYLQVCEMNLRTKDFNAIPLGQLINAVYVKDEFQKMGIANALITSALKSKRVTESPCIYVDVWEENIGAIRLYKQFGFSEVGKCELVIGERVIGEDLVLVKTH